MLRLVFAAGLMLTATAAPAAAQTAEEAVAYVLMGLADGATLNRATTTFAWKELSASPASFEGDGNTGGKKYKIRFTVTALDDCTYDIVLEGPPNMVRMGKAEYAKVDLRKLDSASVGEHALKVQVEGHGFCETGTLNPTCMEVATSDLFGFVDTKKHAESFAFLRNEVCKARAG